MQGADGIFRGYNAYAAREARESVAEFLLRDGHIIEESTIFRGISQKPKPAAYALIKR